MDKMRQKWDELAKRYASWTEFAELSNVGREVLQELLICNCKL